MSLPETRPTRTVFIGTGPFGIEALRALASSRADDPFELVGVVTTPGRPAGRRGDIRPSPIELAGLDLRVRPILSLPRLRPTPAVDAVLALDPELIVLADDGRIVPSALLAIPFGALNLHPSLLPRHRGATPIASTILAGEAETGVTIIQMDDGIDTGPIVAVERFRLDGAETSPELERRLGSLAADLLMRTIGPWLRGEIVPEPQDDQQATVTQLLRRDDGRLSPAQSVAALERQVRAFKPWPGTFVTTELGRIAIHAASTAALEPGDVQGTLVGHGETFALVASDGRLVVDEAQPAGGSRMTGAELRRGRPNLLGSMVD